MTSTVALVVWIVAFVVVTVTVTALTRRAPWSTPIALVAVGVGASFVPGVPPVTIDPQAILYGVVPPLLFASAIQASARGIGDTIDRILVLSVGLVVFTAVVVGLATWVLVPGSGLAAAVAFGAVVASTDSVTVNAVTSGLPLGRRLATILEGEGLLNDATAIVTLTAAITAVSTTLRPDLVAGMFALEVVVGVSVGFVVGWVLSLVRRRLRATVLDTALSIVTPFLAYILSSLLEGSGVLAVVIAGLFLGSRSQTVQSGEARLAERINWRTIAFLLENAVFLFIGLNLRSIVAAGWRHGPGLGTTILACAGVLVALVVSRVVWVNGVTFIYKQGPAPMRQRAASWPNTLAVSAAGIRGVVTLVTAFLLPDIPQRPFLQLLAVVVVVGTMLEGLLFAPILRLVRTPMADTAQELADRRTLMIEAESAALAELEGAAARGDAPAIVDQLREATRFQVATLGAAAVTAGSEQPLDTYNRLRRRMLEAKRRAVLRARTESRYSDQVVGAVLAGLDAEEASLPVDR